MAKNSPNLIRLWINPTDRESLNRTVKNKYTLCNPLKENLRKLFEPCCARNLINEKFIKSMLTV